MYILGTGGKYFNASSSHSAMKILDSILQHIQAEMTVDETILTFMQMGVKNPKDIAARMGLSKSQVNVLKSATTHKFQVKTRKVNAINMWKSFKLLLPSDNKI